MSFRTWFRRPPHRLIALFLCVTVIPSVLLMAFGWRLLTQDRELGLQQVQERREQAADLVVSALEQNLTAAESALRDRAALETLANTADAIVIVFEGGAAHAFPQSRLLFYPRSQPGLEAAAHVFAAGEELEHRAADPARAAAWFQQRTKAPDKAVRAGALIRLARTLRRLNDNDGALRAYAEAATIDGAAVTGVPADLLARWARCELLADLGRTDELRRDASALYKHLLDGRWQIDRATFELHVADAGRWSGAPRAAAPSPTALVLAESVESLWRTWHQRATTREVTSGRDSHIIDGIALTLLWQGNADRFAALVAGPDYVERQWRSKVAATLDRQRIRITLRDPTSRGGAPTESRRAAADSGLPWTVAVESLAQGDARNLTGAQMLWLAGLAIIATFVAAGSYVIARAVSRELAVARLQNDFVAAVSHEFRTPLTSLRQLTEILIDRPDTSEPRRRSYYEALGRQTERLQRLVESLLDFGRMEADSTPYRLQRIDAREVIQSVVEQFQPEAARRGHCIELHMNGQPAMMAADREALSTALWNLLDNAVKYSPHSPSVWLTAEREGAALAIHVRDAGHGIPRHEQRDIFHKFVRGARAKAEHINGTGIGLAMVHHIVTAHGGSVSVQSEPGSGSTFTVRLPIEEACHES